MPVTQNLKPKTVSVSNKSIKQLNMQGLEMMPEPQVPPLGFTFTDFRLEDFPIPNILDGALRTTTSFTEMTTGLVKDKIKLTSPSGNKYQIERLLAESTYGNLDIASCTSAQTLTPISVAIKNYSKKIIEEKFTNCKENPFKEIAAMQLLKPNGIQGRNIVNLIECFQDNEYIYVVLEYYEKGEFYGNLLSLGTLTENQVLTYFKEILRGMTFLQEKRICHMDLSLENLVLSSDGRVVIIIDFGLCRLVDIHPESGAIIPLPLIGNPYGKINYIAPEMFAKRPFNGFTADIWSLGVILFRLLVGRFPIQVCRNMTTLNQIYVHMAAILSVVKSNIKPNMSDNAFDLLCGVLTVNPNERFTLTQILNHPFINT
eukprot:gene4446-8859_t